MRDDGARQGPGQVEIRPCEHECCSMPRRWLRRRRGLCSGRANGNILTAMKIDVHCHQIEKFFHETLAALPGVTVKVNPDRFSYLMKDGKTWLPFHVRSRPSHPRDGPQRHRPLDPLHEYAERLHLRG